MAEPVLDVALTPNIPLLRKVMEHIEAHPDEWDQTYWRTERDCGTAFCFAGWACQLNGDKWTSDSAVTVDGEWMPAEERARGLLGLTWEQAESLFDGHNSRATLRWIVSEIAGEQL